MLRNFRLRRRLDLLPDSGGNLPDPKALRWLRQAWRPQRLPALAGGGEAAARSDDARASSEAAAKQEDRPSGEARPLTSVALVADLQQHVEEGYSALNQERRNQGALAEGLRRQGESVAAIAAESGRLKAQLEQVQRETQERTVENSRLSQQLGHERSTRANELTQAAVLANAVGKLGGGGTAAEGGSSPTAAAALQELASCRAQIVALVQENEVLMHGPYNAGGMPVR